MKKLLMIAALATLGATTMAVPPSLQPPVTTGNAGNSSSTEVRITANVVQGIAVNEASPIDFGNLAKGMYTGIVTQNTPGKIHVKGTAADKVNLKLDKDTADLVWTGFNGAADDTNGSKTTITNVNIHGLTTKDEKVTLSTTGEYTRLLTASFTAGNSGPDDNLGPQQKLGSYVGTVLVTATKTQ
ncbi:hypothetical protein [Cetobacterium sp.]|uniref:hypothetical protein n=1 Tax=Cetobacterium sp. TaxID=2071632 RepID=UPI003F2A5E33